MVTKQLPKNGHLQSTIGNCDQTHFLSMFFLKKGVYDDCYTSSLPLISLTDRCRPSQCRSCKTLQNNKVYRKCTLCNSFPLRRLRSLEYKAIISDIKLEPGICCSQLKLYGGWRIASLEISLLLSNCFNFFHLSNDLKEEHCQRHNGPEG